MLLDLLELSKTRHKIVHWFIGLTMSYFLLKLFFIYSILAPIPMYVYVYVHVIHVWKYVKYYLS